MDDILELINRRRRQVLVASCLYYQFNTSLVPDHIYDQWARELADLQKRYPEIAREAVYADAFSDFDGESVTGFDLPIYPEIVNTAQRLLRYVEKKQRK